MARAIQTFNNGNWRTRDGTQYTQTVTVYDDGTSAVTTKSISPYSVPSSQKYAHRTTTSNTARYDANNNFVSQSSSGGNPYTVVDKVEAREHGKVERVWTTTYGPTNSSTQMKERVIPEGQTIRTRREVVRDIAKVAPTMEQQEQETQRKLQALTRRQRELDMLGLPHENRNKMIEEGGGTR